MTPNFAQLFAAPSWPDVEKVIRAALTGVDHPHADALRRLLREHGYARPSDRNEHGRPGLADLMREAEERIARMDAEDREREAHA